MVKWVVGDSVDYEVNGTWYPGYIARSDSKKLYFKYEASKFKSYEEPIDKTSRDDLARLRAGTGSGPPAAAKKKKPTAKKSYDPGVRGTEVVASMAFNLFPTQAREEARGQVSGEKEDRREARGPETRGEARGQEACQEVVRARVHRRAAAAAPRETPAQAREEEVARPQEKEVAV